MDLISVGSTVSTSKWREHEDDGEVVQIHFMFVHCFIAVTL